MRFHDMTFRGNSIVSAQQMVDRFYRADTSLRFQNRLEKLKEWLLKQINEAEKAEWNKPWVQEKIELLSNEEYHTLQAYLAKKRGIEGEAIYEYEVEPKELARLIVRKMLKPMRKRIKELRFVDFTGIYKQLFSDPMQLKRLKMETPAEWTAICQATIQSLDEGHLSYEDATPFLYVKEQIQGFQTNSSITHIVVDEAQDYSAFQFEFLKLLFPSSKMTVLGDFNQAIFAHASEMADFHSLTDLYGADKTEVINIARSYRSTKPIIEFTRRLVPNGDKIIPFDRGGTIPELKRVEDDAELHSCISSKVAELRDQRLNTIAIICKSAEESSRAYEGLSEIEGIKLLKSSSTEYEQGVVVVPSYLSKGIEFDAVIIYDASERVYGDESLRRIFYTACTRAMHVLQLYSVGEPSSLLQNAFKEGFIEN